MPRLMVLLFATVISVSAFADVNSTETNSACPAFLDVTMRKLHSSEQVDLCQLTKDKTVLAVNTASNCGFTPQFKALEKLHKEYQSKGLVIIGFPSDDFFQEENDEKDTAKVCFVNYGVTFTMLQTSEVRGKGANTVFKHLGNQTTSPKWNFYKYLISNNGKDIRHFNSRVTPDSSEFIQAIEAAL